MACRKRGRLGLDPVVGGLGLSTSILLWGDGIKLFFCLRCKFSDMLVMDIGLNVKQEDWSQAVKFEVVRVFMDEKVKSSAVPPGVVSCTPGEVKSAPSDFS